MADAYLDDPGVRWMLAWKAGDEAAFERLVVAYSDKLYALFTRFLGPTAEREDLVQETFLRVLRARDGYEPAARFSTWLYRIAFNLAVNRTERTRASSQLEEEGTSAQGAAGAVDDPSLALERADVVAAVRRAVAELPESQRIALVLARYEELSFAEIAQVIGSSEKAVKSLVHRARENLRLSLAPFLQQVSP